MTGSISMRQSYKQTRFWVTVAVLAAAIYILTVRGEFWVLTPVRRTLLDDGSNSVLHPTMNFPGSVNVAVFALPSTPNSTELILNELLEGYKLPTAFSIPYMQQFYSSCNQLA